MSNDHETSKKRWNKAVEETLARAPERRRRFETSSGIEVERLYGPEHLTDDLVERSGHPGQAPFTRGIQPTMYRSRFWTMRQYSGFGTAAVTNRRFHYLMEQGQTGLSVAFDLPTQMGYDSDHEMAAGEVGKVGVAISSLDDMLELFDGVPLQDVSTSMTINATAPILLALYVAVARIQGANLRQLSGTVQNDLLKEYIARGTYIYPPAASLRLTSDVFAWCRDELPRWNTISISGYHMREAGSTAVQELAFTLANAIAYCDTAIERGLKFEQFAGRLSFFFNGHSNFFEEVAKFRAARRLWASIAKERYGAVDENLCRLRFHTQTAGSTLTAQQPEVNVVRTTMQALSAVLGGTQSLHTNSMDEALGLPTESAALLALRTQQVIAHETGIGDTIDPLAGSYFVESLTAAVERGARDYLDKIDSLGGAVRAIESGFQQREIHEAAYRWQTKLDAGEAVVVGVNRFVSADPPRPERTKIDDRLERTRAEGLARLRAGRDESAAEVALTALEAAARGSANLMPRILDAVEARCTLGAITDRMKAVFGVHRDPFTF